MITYGLILAVFGVFFMVMKRLMGTSYDGPRPKDMRFHPAELGPFWIGAGLLLVAVGVLLKVW